LTGELFLKQGMNQVGELSLQLPELMPGLLRTFTTPTILIGFVLMFCGSILWLAAISRVDFSWAYPMLSMGYVFGVVASWIILGEQFNLSRLVGALVVFSGVVIIARS
jgi:drug/metabolite transporter (DMT)-like permease